MSGLKLVLFDCDGTLVDSQHMIVAAMDVAFRENGLEPLPREKVLSIVGLSLHEAVGTLLPEAAVDVLLRVTEAYRDAFSGLRGRKDLHEPLFEGTREALDRLAARDDVLLGIVTGKSRKGLRNILTLHDIVHYFVTLQTADDAPSKPHPGMVARALEETGALAADTAVIGDTSFDMIMASNAGASGVGVSWGYHAPEALVRAGARHVLGGFHELHGILHEFWKEEREGAQ